MSTHSTNTPLIGTVRPLGILRHILHVLAIRRQRNDLASLDDHALDDIGISRYEADIEARRSVWDVPQYWRH